MTQKKYIYPDVDDVTATIFIENNEPYKGYWERSEEEVLKKFIEISKKKKYKSILDIGAASGRLAQKYINYFQNITFVEPDLKRLSKAKHHFKSHKSIQYVNDTFISSNLGNQKYDIIICSYVLQLIKTTSLEKFVNKLYKHLSPKGHMFILLAHSRRNYDVYTKNYIAYSDIRSKRISKESFNSLRRNQENILAMHHFSIPTVKSTFSKFKIIDIKFFHLFHKINWIDKFIFRDDFYNVPWLRKNRGQDLCIHLKKHRRTRAN